MDGDLLKQVAILMYGVSFYVHLSLVMVAFLIFIQHHKIQNFMQFEYSVLLTIVTIDLKVFQNEAIQIYFNPARY